MIGAAAGGLSLLLFPDVIRRREGLRIFLLFSRQYLLEQQVTGVLD